MDQSEAVLLKPFRIENQGICSPEFPQHLIGFCWVIFTAQKIAAV